MHLGIAAVSVAAIVPTIVPLKTTFTGQGSDYGARVGIWIGFFLVEVGLETALFVLSNKVTKRASAELRCSSYCKPVRDTKFKKGRRHQEEELPMVEPRNRRTWRENYAETVK